MGFFFGEPQSCLSLAQALHERLLLIFWQKTKKSRHREQKRLRIPIVQLAPARKSAQTISRQYPRERLLPSISAAVSSARSITGIWLL